MVDYETKLQIRNLVSPDILNDNAHIPRVLPHVGLYLYDLKLQTSGEDQFSFLVFTGTELSFIS